MVRRNTILQHYQQRVTPERESFEILDWGSQEEQQRRFQVLEEVLQEHGIAASGDADSLALLDVGCGMGDLHSYLTRQQAAELQYVGVDIVESILREARARQKHSHFVLADVFEAPPFPAHSFDVVFCSGVFNLKLGNNEAFALRALPRLFDLCSQCLMVNFLHERTPQKYPHCWYFSPERILESLPPHMQTVQLVDDYLDKDFSLLIRPG